MAQTKRKRTRKHRGTPAGTIERAGRTGRPQTREDAKAIARERRATRLDRPPAWRSAVNRAAIAAAVFGVLLVVLFGRPPAAGAALDALGVTLDGILVTHTHFDHIGAVAEVARATGAEVWVPKMEAFVLEDIDRYVPWPGFGPFENHKAEHTLNGGERLELAGF